MKTTGVKHGSEIQTKPLHSLPMETGTAHQNPIAPCDEYRLNGIHQLRMVMSIAITPSVVNNTIHVQQAADIPVASTNNGVINGNKTLETISGFNIGKRYKRETTLKFSDGSVECYESFKSQFNIHHKMLGWDTRRAGVELYMSFCNGEVLLLLVKPGVHSLYRPLRAALSGTIQTLHDNLV